jgi:hypothetical protein
VWVWSITCIGVGVVNILVPPKVCMGVVNILVPPEVCMGVVKAWSLPKSVWVLSVALICRMLTWCCWWALTQDWRHLLSIPESGKGELDPYAAVCSVCMCIDRVP